MSQKPAGGLKWPGVVLYVFGGLACISVGVAFAYYGIQRAQVSGFSFDTVSGFVLCVFPWIGFGLFVWYMAFRLATGRTAKIDAAQMLQQQLPEPRPADNAFTRAIARLREAPQFRIFKDPVVAESSVAVAFLVIGLALPPVLSAFNATGGMWSLLFLLALALIYFGLNGLFQLALGRSIVPWGFLLGGAVLKSARCGKCGTDFGGKEYRHQLRHGHAICPRCGAQAKINLD